MQDNSRINRNLARLNIHSVSAKVLMPPTSNLKNPFSSKYFTNQTKESRFSATTKLKNFPDGFPVNLVLILKPAIAYEVQIRIDLWSKICFSSKMHHPS
jgi:hypothetical protein